ncbi:hypothetical protein [uncultured Parasphingopyxis sp.]|uniref:hypothetical protein n=1 Tax=uncultured Parasphingopyxis sp. TaxID=1547918 RepID=UPI0026353A77|nr:hypothetical protein [uncultured Parasphingopyxis sp.]
MASFTFVDQGIYSFSGDTATFVAEVNGTNTITDNEPDGTFEVGDTMFIGGSNVGTFAGTIMLAEGAPAETFVDHVTRRRFDNFAEYEALYGDEAMIASLDMPRVSAARLVPQQLRERLSKRAA